MSRIHCGWLVGMMVLTSTVVRSQVPAPPAPRPTQDQPPPPTEIRSYASVPSPHNSILRQRPWHEDFLGDRPRYYGFRNPGGIGRMAEVYGPDNQFQLQVPRTAEHITAKIGLGGVPDRNEQLRSQMVGTAYYNSLQTHIDRYGRPMFGFGLGFGFN